MFIDFEEQNIQFQPQTFQPQTFLPQFLFFFYIQNVIKIKTKNKKTLYKKKSYKNPNLFESNNKIKSKTAENIKRKSLKKLYKENH